MAEIEQREVRWHPALLIPRLTLSDKERKIAIAALSAYLEDRSSIVKTFALQGLADLAEGYAARGDRAFAGSYAEWDSRNEGKEPKTADAARPSLNFTRQTPMKVLRLGIRRHGLGRARSESGATRFRPKLFCGRSRLHARARQSAAKNLRR